MLLLVVARFILLQCGTRGVSRPADAPPRPTSAEVPAASADSSPPLRGSEASIAESVHLALGVPRAADPKDDQFLDERTFVLSYSAVKRVPNWVAWRLDRSYLGHVHRKDDFRPDPLLPARFYRVNEHDYLHSGYDRGHMCPSADRDATPADNSSTFLFTNMQPQLHELNAGPWERLETYARQRAERGEVLYIVAGGVFSAPFPTIGNGVAVPAANFKIIVALRAGRSAQEVTESDDALAVLMPNQHGVGAHDWTEYLTSVDAIERATGYDFLGAIPEKVQRVIEARTAQP